MGKRIITEMHSWLGLTAGIFILLLSVSGTILVFHEELDSLQKPAVAYKEHQMLSVNNCYAIVKNAYPGAAISSCQLPRSPMAYSFFIYDPAFDGGNTVHEIFVNPFTGKIEGSRGGSNDMRHNFMGWLSKFHNSFHAGKTGEWLSGVFAVVFVLSLVTGLFLYRENIFAVLLFRRSVFNKNGLHQVIGVYALLFNLMMGISGYWMQRYVFKKDFYAANAWVTTVKPSPVLTYSIDSAITNVKSRYPYFAPYVIYFAQSTQGKTAVYGSNSNNAFIHSKKFADVIALDSSGAISKTRFVNENAAGDYYDIVNSQLHMARYGGWFIKLLYGLFGITGALLSISGFLLWLKRKRRKAF